MKDLKFVNTKKNYKIKQYVILKNKTKCFIIFLYQKRRRK